MTQFPAPSSASPHLPGSDARLPRLLWEPGSSFVLRGRNSLSDTREPEGAAEGTPQPQELLTPLSQAHPILQMGK